MLAQDKSFFPAVSHSKGIPPIKKEGEKKEDMSNNMEGKGIASRIIGPFKPVSTRTGVTGGGGGVAVMLQRNPMTDDEASHD